MDGCLGAFHAACGFLYAFFLLNGGGGFVLEFGLGRGVIVLVYGVFGL